MKLSQQSLSLIESTIRKAVGKFERSHEQTTITDIFLQPNSTSGEFCLFDDEDTDLGNVLISEWVSYEGDDFLDKAGNVLRPILNGLRHEGLFDKLNILQPYSFVLIDEDKETITDLLLMDDDTLLVDGGLLAGLDEELDSFLKDLLEK